jgi:hypothetical protein
MIGGAGSDGTTPYSHKIVTSSTGPSSTLGFFESFNILKWNSVTGSVTVNIALISSASLNNNEIWMEVQYLGDSGSPLGSETNTLPATVLTTAAAVPTDATNSWHNAPGTPQQQILSATFTVNQVGWIRGIVRIAKTSKTLWINPQFT